MLALALRHLPEAVFWTTGVKSNGSDLTRALVPYPCVCEGIFLSISVEQLSEMSEKGPSEASVEKFIDSVVVKSFSSVATSSTIAFGEISSVFVE